MADFCIECGMYVGQGCTCDTDFTSKIQRDYSHLLKQKQACEDRSYSFENQIITLNDELDGYKEAFKQEQLWRRDLKSTLDEIQIILHEDFFWDYKNKLDKLQKAIDKYEDKT